MGILLAGPWLQGWRGAGGSEHLSDVPSSHCPWAGMCLSRGFQLTLHGALASSHTCRKPRQVPLGSDEWAFPPLGGTAE